MANLMVILPDYLKEKWQAQCSARGVSMSKLIVSWITKNVREGNPEPFTADEDDGSPIETCTCLLCDFEWTPKKANPAACPACKSYQWNNPEFAAKRVVKIAKRDAKIVKREAKAVKQLERNLESEFSRIIRLSALKTTQDVANKIGIPKEELQLYLSREKPVTAELIERMRLITS